MAFCVVCCTWGKSGLCRSCRSQLRAAPPVHQMGIEAISGLIHEKVARRLVHLLKYQGMPAAGVILGAVMAKRVPAGTEALIPIPRAPVRRIRFGIDPALELAYRVGEATGIAVVPALRCPLWWPSHARGERASRQGPQFRPIRTVPSGSVLVDDVLTTGATLAAAGRVLGLNRALTATWADSRSFE